VVVLGAFPRLGLDRCRLESVLQPEGSARLACVVVPALQGIRASLAFKRKRMREARGHRPVRIAPLVDRPRRFDWRCDATGQPKARFVGVCPGRVAAQVRTQPISRTLVRISPIVITETAAS